MGDRCRRVRGHIAGKHEGASLDALDVATLTGSLTDIDEESRALLMAYLDRREPSWREHAQGDAAAGRGRSAWSTGKMTEEEAYQILGVQPGASAEQIGHAHRALMKKLHPDQGESTYLAARVNEAKDVLCAAIANFCTRRNSWRLLFNAVPVLNHASIGVSS